MSQCPLCQRVLGLTKRQWRVIELLHQGLSDKQIAIHDDITVRAVGSVIQRIREMTGMKHRSRAELILKCGELKEQRASGGD